MSIHTVSRLIVSGLMSTFILFAVLGNNQAQAGRSSVPARLGIDVARGLGLLKAARPDLSQHTLEKMAGRLDNMQRRGQIDDTAYMHLVEQLCAGKGPQDPEHVCNWACTVARNYCIDERRKWEKDNPDMLISEEPTYDTHKDVMNKSDDLMPPRDVIRERIKRNKSTSEVSAQEIFTGSRNNGAMEEQYDRKQLVNCINEAMAALGNKALPMQMFLDHIPYKTIALELDIPEGTVKSKIARFRNQLRDACKKYLLR